jgi:hypothetical protein
MKLNPKPMFRRSVQPQSYKKCPSFSLIIWDALICFINYGLMDYEEKIQNDVFIVKIKKNNLKNQFKNRKKF